MSLLETVTAAMSEISSLKEMSDGVRVTTHCIYPSNGFVQVVVRGGPHSFRVTDEGGALREIESAGVAVPRVDTKLKQLIQAHGLTIRDGVIGVADVTREGLPVAIALVSNITKDAADWLYDHCKIRRERDFKKMVRDFLNKAFEEQPPKEDTVVGASNKPHKFDNVIQLPGGKRLIVDPVVRDANSVNSRVVANLDVKELHRADVIQRIVYDDLDDWQAADLNLLTVGAPVVPFSRSVEVFMQILKAA